MANFIIKRTDGGISIGHLVEGELNDCVKKWEDCGRFKSQYHQFENRFPNDTDGNFHDAYDHTPERGVFIDLEKAKPVHVNNLRKLRTQKFIDMGFPYKLNPHVENAILDDETKNQLKSLRDFPEAIDLSKATDIESLTKIIPDCLK